MPRRPQRRTTNQKRRRRAIRRTSRVCRSLALNATQQQLLENLHEEIVKIQDATHETMAVFGLVNLLSRVVPSRSLKSIKLALLYAMGSLVACLQACMDIDSSIADIDLEEERQHQQERRLNRPQNRLTSF